MDTFAKTLNDYGLVAGIFSHTPATVEDLASFIKKEGFDELEKNTWAKLVQNLFDIQIKDLKKFQEKFLPQQKTFVLEPLFFQEATLEITEEGYGEVYTNTNIRYIEKQLREKVKENESVFFETDKKYALQKTFQPEQALIDLVKRQMEKSKEMTKQIEEGIEMKKFQDKMQRIVSATVQQMMEDKLIP